jgi:hypothetical protein
LKGALENRELLIVESLDEELRHAAQMDGHGFSQSGEARVGDCDHPADIGIGAGSRSCVSTDVEGWASVSSLVRRRHRSSRPPG